MVTSCHQIDNPSTAVAAFPTILGGNDLQHLRGRVLRAVSDMSGRLTDGAGPRVAGDTTANLVLDIVRQDELAALRDVAVRAVGSLYLDLSDQELTQELRSEEQAIFLGGDGLAAAAWREQRLVRQRQREELLQAVSAVLVPAGGASNIVEGDIVGASAATALGRRILLVCDRVARGRVVAVDIVLLVSIVNLVAHVDSGNFLEQIVVNVVVAAVEGCALDHHWNSGSGGAVCL